MQAQVEVNVVVVGGLSHIHYQKRSRYTQEMEKYISIFTVGIPSTPYFYFLLSLNVSNCQPAFWSHP